MRKQYTVSSSAGGPKLAPPKKRIYPDSLHCQHCGEPFKPNKDRKRFCSQKCFQDWEKAKAAEIRPFGRPTGRKVKQMSAASIKEFRQTGNSFADRCQFWMAEFEKDFRAKSNLSGKREIRLPLLLTGHGISLRIESGALHVRDGLTHYPQERHEYRFFPGKHNTPSRIVLLGNNGSVSVDVLCWLSAQQIPLVVIDFQGHELVSICSIPSATDYELRIAQLIATKPEHALELAKGFIRAKIAGCISNLDLWPESQTRRYAKHKLTEHLHSIELVQTTNELFVLEAASALQYFKAWQEIPIKWAAKSEKFIPEDWFYVSGRESKVGGRNRNASHPVNAILNYAYAALESQVRIACAMFGIDPSISYLHAMQHDRQSLIFDLIEPLRPLVDKKVIEFVKAVAFSKDDFVISLNGSCKLGQQLSKRIANLLPPDGDIQKNVTDFRDQVLRVHT